MNKNMIIPGLKDMIIHEIKEYLDRVAIHVSLAKKEKAFKVVKTRLLDFNWKVEETQNSAFLKAIKTFKNWQVEILNRYVFGYSNGILEGINNTSKMIKRNAYGFRKHEHFKAKILLSSIYSARKSPWIVLVDWSGGGRRLLGDKHVRKIH